MGCWCPNVGNHSSCLAEENCMLSKVGCDSHCLWPCGYQWWWMVHVMELWLSHAALALLGVDCRGYLHEYNKCELGWIGITFTMMIRSFHRLYGEYNNSQLAVRVCARCQCLCLNCLLVCVVCEKKEVCARIASTGKIRGFFLNSLEVRAYTSTLTVRMARSAYRSLRSGNAPLLGINHVYNLRDEI